MKVTYAIQAKVTCPADGFAMRVGKTEKGHKRAVLRALNILGFDVESLDVIELTLPSHKTKPSNVIPLHPKPRKST